MLKKLLSIADGPVLEELVWSLGESVRLTVVDEDGTFIDDWHRCEALLWVQESVESCDDATCDKDSNYNVILMHVVCLLPLARPSTHGYTNTKLVKYF